MKHAKPDIQAPPPGAPEPRAISRFERWLDFGARALPWVASLVIWVIFNPGIFTPDGTHVAFLGQTGDYCNPHPIILTVIARLCQQWFLYPGSISLLQAFLLVFGIRYLALQSLTLLDGENANGATRRERRAALILLLMLTPLTPTLFVAVTFLKDGWMLIALCWFTGALARLSHRNPEWTPARAVVLIVAASLTLAAAVLFRFNAVLILPIYCLLLAVVVPHPRLCALAILPLVLFFSINGALNRFLHVREEYPERQVMFLDIMGLCVLDAKMEQEFPELMAYVSPQYRQLYRFGEMHVLPQFSRFNFVMYGNEQPRQQGFVKDALVARAYPKVLEHPWLLMQTKIRSFLRLYLGFHDQEVFSRGVFQFPMSIQENPHFAGARAALYDFYSFWLEHSPLRRLLGSHAVWNVLGLIVAFRLFRRRHPLRWIMLVPVLYPSTFILATTGMDRRFLDPSTLILQVLLLVMAFGRPTKA